MPSNSYCSSTVLYKNPDLNNFYGLTCLNISKTRLHHFHPEIVKLENLVKLDISRNYLTSLPHEIANLNHLNHLDLSHNKLISFPLGIRSMQLQRLDASNNPLCSSLNELLWLQADDTSNEIKLAGMANEKFLEQYPQKEVQNLQETIITYFALKDKKWLEIIDGCFHSDGREVFDTGAHEGDIEPGYIDSMENACIFVAASLFRKIDAAWYLQLHRFTCAHFGDDSDGFTDMKKNRVGTFRGMLDSRKVYIRRKPSNSAYSEFKNFENKLKKIFGSHFALGDFYSTGGDWYLVYNPYTTSSEIKKTINWLLANLYQKLDHAPSDEAKLRAIAKFHQRIMWLHPPMDGTYRTNMLILNKLLVENGFTPVILDYHPLCIYTDLDLFVEILKVGMRTWEKEL